MKAEQTIAEIERLERIFAAPDTRPLSPSDISAANRRHDEMLAHSPGFGCGNSMEFAAEVKPKADLGFRARAVFPVWKNSDIGYRIKRSIDELISKQALALGRQQQQKVKIAVAIRPFRSKCAYWRGRGRFLRLTSTMQGEYR